MKKLIFLSLVLAVSCNAPPSRKNRGKALDKKSVENMALAKRNITNTNSPFCFATEVILDNEAIILLNAQFYWAAEEQGNHLQFTKTLKKKNFERNFEITDISWVFDAYKRLELDTLNTHTLLVKDKESNEGYISIQIKSDSIENTFFIDRKAYHLSEGINPTLLSFTKALLQNKPYLIE